MRIIIFLFLIFLGRCSIKWPYTLVLDDHSVTPYDLLLDFSPTLGSTPFINLTTVVQVPLLNINQQHCGLIIYTDMKDRRQYSRPFSHPTNPNFFKNAKYYITTQLNLKDPFFRHDNSYSAKIIVGKYTPSLNPYAEVCEYHFAFQFNFSLTGENQNQSKSLSLTKQQ